MKTLNLEPKQKNIFSALKTHKSGLTKEEARYRLKKYGPNKLPEKKPDSYFIIFLRQFQSPLIYILIIAAVIVFLMKEITDGLVISFVLIFNAIIGAIQEGKAQNILKALEKFTETSTTVLRDEEKIIIPASEVVPGDIIILQEGEKIPADAKIILSNNLRINEAALTGESEPVNKIDDELDNKNLTLPEQKNMVFKGTNISYGNGIAVVTATGINTEIGKISNKIANIDTEIPLKKNIAFLSKLIIIFALMFGFILFVMGIGAGMEVKEIFSVVVSLIVSVVPEGLPIVLTLILAMGVFRMSKQNALVKRLQAVEGLGQVKIIAVDKTGTITKNEQMVKEAFILNKEFNVDGTGYEPKGNIYKIEESLKKAINNPKNCAELEIAGRVISLCANAHVSLKTENKEKSWQVTGDPTEAALLVFANKIGFNRDELLEEHTVIKEFPFDYKKKFKASLSSLDGTKSISVIGAPEIVFKLSELSKKELIKLEKVLDDMSNRGIRTVAIAKKDKVKELNEEHMPKLDFLGIIGLQDTLRPEVHKAIEKAENAGVKIVMITGDHKITAKAVAEEAGIFKDNDKIITGNELYELSDKELSKKIKDTTIFARVTPDDKLKIIQAYRKAGITVAMTGDGVNDAPPLAAADIGVSMGKIGTEVTKEASDIILLDDNFGSIVSAIEEGRQIYKTIKKVMLYLFSTGFGELFTIIFALFIGLPLPLLASQIIWLNLITDGFLVLALAVEPKDKNILTEKFLKPSKYILDFNDLKRMLIMGIVMMGGTLVVFNYYLKFNYQKALTMSLATLAVYQWFNALNCIHAKKSILKTNLIKRKYLIWSLILVFILQLLAIYNPFMQKVLHTVPINLLDWVVAFGVSLSVILIEEFRKYIVRKTAVKKE